MAKAEINEAAASLGRLGGIARARKLTKARRIAIATIASKAAAEKRRTDAAKRKRTIEPKE